jgi:flagellar hook-length control protein FliK
MRFFPDTLINQALDLYQFGELVDTFDGSSRQKRNLEKLHKGAIARVEKQQAARVAAAAEELSQRTQRIIADALARQEECDDVFDALDTGRIEVKEARKVLTSIGHEQRAIQERITQLRADEQSTAALADMESAEFEASYLATTPALRRSLPVVNADMLNRP